MVFDSGIGVKEVVFVVLIEERFLDFGLAKLSTKETPGVDGATMTSQQTAAGIVMGTASYMAPEQVRGGQIDARTEMFSFGVVLYEMLSGKRVFQRDSAPETMTAILKEDVPEFTDTKLPVSPALERIVRRCLEKSPEQRFQSAKDLAFPLEAVSQISGPKTGAQAPILAPEPQHKSQVPLYAAALVLAAAMLGLGWWFGHSKPPTPAEYRQFTFRAGFMGNARFTPDGNVIYNAIWEGSDTMLYIAPVDSLGERELPFKDAEILSISRKGELAIRLNTTIRGGYAQTGTLARVNASGGTPRAILENVQDADWSADGEKLAIVRLVPETSHWRLEYPIGTVLLDSINWISAPRISTDGKSIAFLDHENTIGDDRGTVAVIGLDGKEKKLSSGWNSVEGVVWSPSGSEIWFSASNQGAEDNLHAVTLEGKRRTLANIPGGLWIQDIRNGTVLAIAHRLRLNARGMAPGAKAEVELGWLGWTFVRDISRDGKQIVRRRSRRRRAELHRLSARNRRLTTDASGRRRRAGTFTRRKMGYHAGPHFDRVEDCPNRRRRSADAYARQRLLRKSAIHAGRKTSDCYRYRNRKERPHIPHRCADGRCETADAGRLQRHNFFADGSKVAMRGPDGTWGVWTMADSKFTPIPSLDPKYSAIDWTRDDRELYVISNELKERRQRVYRLDPKTGKMEFWKEFGGNMTGIQGVGPPLLAQDADAYAYFYTQLLSEGYVVKNLQ